MIEIRTISEDEPLRFEVTVSGAGGDTHHQVTLPAETRQRLPQGHSPEDCVDAARLEIPARARTLSGDSAVVRTDSRSGEASGRRIGRVMSRTARRFHVGVCASGAHRFNSVGTSDDV